MKSINRIIAVLVIIVFALIVFPTLSAPSDTKGIVSASDNQTPSDTNSVRPSTVTGVDEPADPPLKRDSGSITISKSGNDQQQFAAIAEDNMSVNSSELTTFAEVGTVSESRAEIILPAQNISAVQELDWVEQVQKQRFGTVPDSYSSNVENISSIEADQLHKDGINGENVKIGFIGYGPYVSDVPYEEQVVDTRNFKYDRPIYYQREPYHDTAALEQVSEMAPQSEFYISAIRTQTDFNRAIEYMIESNVDVILTEVTFPVAPGDGTGDVAQKVDQATEAGITVVSPAGNGRAGHYEDNFYNPDDDRLHNFNGEDETNRIGGEGSEVDGQYRFTLIWSDFDSAVQSDYDLYIYNERTEEYVASSNEIDYYPRTPAEIVIYQTDGYEPISLVISHRSGDSIDDVEILAGNRYGYNPLEYHVPEGSIVPPATAQSAVGVAAYNTPNQNLAIYSNQGPIGARSGITVTGYSHLSSDYYAYGFGGTSGAAPYVAGTVGLMNGVSNDISPQQTKSTIRSTAEHLPQPPQRAGGGLIDAPAAVKAVSSSEPSNFDIEIDSTNAPILSGGRLEVTVTVTNTGDQSATKDVELSLPVGNGANKSDSTNLTLVGGESQDTTLSVNTSDGNSGSHTVEVSTPDDSATQQIMINEQNGTVAITNVVLEPTKISGESESEHNLSIEVQNLSADGSDDNFEVVFPNDVVVENYDYDNTDVSSITQENERTLVFSVDPRGGGTVQKVISINVTLTAR